MVGAGIVSVDDEDSCGRAVGRGAVGSEKDARDTLVVGGKTEIWGEILKRALAERIGGGIRCVRVALETPFVESSA